MYVDAAEYSNDTALYETNVMVKRNLDMNIDAT